MLSALIAPITGLLDKVIPDADTKVKIAHELATMSERHAQEVTLQQIEVLKAVNFLISPSAAGFGVVIPQADMSVMMPLLLGMLGISGMRSFDKVKKTDSKVVK